MNIIILMSYPAPWLGVYGLYTPPGPGGAFDVTVTIVHVHTCVL